MLASTAPFTVMKLRGLAMLDQCGGGNELSLAWDADVAVVEVDENLILVTCGFFRFAQRVDVSLRRNLTVVRERACRRGDVLLRRRAIRRGRFNIF